MGRNGEKGGEKRTEWKEAEHTVVESWSIYSGPGYYHQDYIPYYSTYYHYYIYTQDKREEEPYGLDSGLSCHSRSSQRSYLTKERDFTTVNKSVPFPSYLLSTVEYCITYQCKRITAPFQCHPLPYF